MKTDIVELGTLKERLKAALRIEPLGIELVGYDTAVSMDNDFPTYQPIAITGEIA